jgi:hypothetical protein
MLHAFHLDVPEAGHAVSAVLHAALDALPTAPVLLLGHGLANNLDHPLVLGTLERLAAAGIPGLRFNFPYAERGVKEADARPVLLATFGAAVAWARAELGPDRPLVLGGKSLGARMAAAYAVAHGGAAGLLYLGFPLHPPTGATEIRATDLCAAPVPQLLLVGDQDPFCDLGRLAEVRPRIGSPFRLEVFPGGDHGLGLDRAAPEAAVSLLDRIAAVTHDWLRETTIEQS